MNTLIITGAEWAIAGVLCATLIVSLYVKRIRGARKRFPPGPPGLPLIGNVLDMPTEYSWLTYHEWGQTYSEEGTGSDVVHMQIFGQSIIVLNSLQAAAHLLEKRSAVTSDRPTSAMLQDILGLGSWHPPIQRYGPNWRAHRKAFNQSFNARAVEAYRHVQANSVQVLMSALVGSAERFRHHLSSHAGRIILKSVYDYDAKPEGDYYVAMDEEYFRQFNAAYGTGKFYLVDVFPSLGRLPLWVPGFAFHRIGARFRALTKHLGDEPYEVLRAKMDEGAAQRCAVVRSFDKIDEESPSGAEELIVVKNNAASAYLAGQDTTTSVLASFVLAMVANPEQQKKARDEIDSVTRRARLPGFEDKDALPGIRRLMIETLRCFPTVPMGLPHRVMQDDTYAGFDIPEGSVIMGNIWAILHDSSIFPSPSKFNPDRYLPDEAPGTSMLGDQDIKHSKFLEEAVLSVAFGFGRRICPGRWLAMDGIWLTMVRLLATFEILKDVDSNGREIEPTVACTNGITSHPQDFKCRFVLRPGAENFLDELHD